MTWFFHWIPDLARESMGRSACLANQLSETRKACGLTKLLEVDMIRNILVPLDISYESDDWAEHALLTASEIASNSSATIHVLSVIPDNLLKGFYPDIYTDEERPCLRRMPYRAGWYLYGNFTDGAGTPC